MMLKYNEEIKILREKVREAEEKEKKKAENAKKQFDYIKKLERELIENGTAIDELEEYPSFLSQAQEKQHFQPNLRQAQQRGRRRRKGIPSCQVQREGGAYRRHDTGSVQ